MFDCVLIKNTVKFLETLKFVFILGDPDTPKSSMVVSMEFNGMKYQGVLFAQTGDTASSQQ